MNRSERDAFFPEEIKGQLNWWFSGSERMFRTNKTPHDGGVCAPDYLISFFGEEPYYLTISVTVTASSGANHCNLL